MTYTLEEIQENRRKWVEALRSGDFQQGEGMLGYTDKEDGVTRFCCLGVACEVLGAPREESDALDRRFQYGGEAEYLPLIIVRKLGVPDRNPSLDNGERLANLNDGGTSFAEIADLIEHNLPLFVYPSE